MFTAWPCAVFSKVFHFKCHSKKLFLLLYFLRRPSRFYCVESHCVESLCVACNRPLTKRDDEQALKYSRRWECTRFCQTCAATPSSGEHTMIILDRSQSRSGSLCPIKLYGSARQCRLGGISHAACEPSDSADPHVNDLTVVSTHRGRDLDLQLCCVLLEAVWSSAITKADELGRAVTTWCRYKHFRMYQRTSCGRALPGHNKDLVQKAELAD